jgi:hypothetical protein
MMMVTVYAYLIHSTRWSRGIGSALYLDVPHAYSTLFQTYFVRGRGKQLQTILGDGYDIVGFDPR